MAYYNDGNGQRESRYNCRNRKPLDLKDALRGLARSLPASGAYTSIQEARGCVMRSCRGDCHEKPSADGLVKFLINTSVFIETGEGLFFDAERGAVIFQACEDQKDPVPPQPPGIRLAQIKALLRKPRAPQEVSSPAVETIPLQEEVVSSAVDAVASVHAPQAVAAGAAIVDLSEARFLEGFVGGPFEGLAALCRELGKMTG